MSDASEVILLKDDAANSHHDGHRFPRAFRNCGTFRLQFLSVDPPHGFITYDERWCDTFIVPELRDYYVEGDAKSGVDAGNHIEDYFHSTCTSMRNSYMMVLLVLATALAFGSCGFLADLNPYNRQRGDFLPLTAQQKFVYTLQLSESDTGYIPYPDTIETSIGDRVIRDGQSYYVASNYFVPGRRLPDTLFMRYENDRVFFRAEGDSSEHMLYSFSEKDSAWSVTFPGRSILRVRDAELTFLDGTSASVSWDLRGYPDDPPFVPGGTESGWGDSFKRGVGRTEIYSVSQGLGTLVWKLQD